MPRLNRHYRAALQPLLDRALALHMTGQRRWLDELRADCPTVVRDLEVLLRDLPPASRHQG